MSTKFSQLPLAGSLVGDEVLIGLKPSGSESDEENVLITVEDLTQHVLNQDSNAGGGGTVDSDDVTYTPTTLADWNGGVDPGDVEQALDQLAERVTDVEGAVTQCIAVACSDETTALTTGTAKVAFRMPYAFTLTGIRASVTTAPTGADLIVDVNESGSTVMTTDKLRIDAGEKTTTTAATPPALTDTALADDAEITIDIDQIGSTIAGAGLKVYLIGTKA